LSGTLEESERMHAAFDLATWQVAEGDAGAHYLLRTTEFFPQAVIHRAGPVSELPPAPMPEIGQIAAATELGCLTLDEFVARGPVHGFVVAHRGTIVYERYPGMRPFDRHLIWSITKTFPAALVAMLTAEGRVDVAAPVDAYLPELSGTAWAGTPIQDVLDMASGIDCLEVDDPNAYTNPNSLFYPYESSLGMLPPSPLARSPREYVASLQRRRPSGEAFEYASVDTFVLGWLAERLFDQPFAEIVSERVWRRMGAEADAACIVGPDGTAATHGGMTATLRDIVRWGMLHTPSWRRISDEPVLPPNYVEAIQSGRPEMFDRAALGQQLIKRLGERPRHNAWQWDFVMEDGDFFKSGYRGQGLYVSPARDLVIAYFGEEEVGQAAHARALATSGLFSA
jgi:CubicO group peptidase (beta-lactamase class C family)